MEIRITRRPRGILRISLAGELDVHELPGLANRVEPLIEAGRVRLVLELSRLRFINSSSLGYLIVTRRNARERGGKLVLSSPSETFTATLAEYGIGNLFEIWPDDEQAERSFADDDPPEDGAGVLAPLR